MYFKNAGSNQHAGAGHGHAFRCALHRLRILQRHVVAQPDGTYYCSDVAGTHNGWLRCPARRFLLALAAVLPARPPAVPSATS